MPEVVCLYEAKDRLGEGPIWNSDDKCLYWCDNVRPCVHRFDPRTRDVKTWPMQEEIGCLVFRRNGGIVGAMKSGFAFVDLDAGKVDQTRP